MAISLARAPVGPAIRIALVAVLMFALATVGIELSRLSGRIASVWLANGAVLAVIMRSHRREWPGLLLASIAANIAANLLSGDPFSVALVLSLCNAIEIGGVAVIFKRNDVRGTFVDPQAICQRDSAHRSLLLGPQALGRQVFDDAVSSFMQTESPEQRGCIIGK